MKYFSDVPESESANLAVIPARVLTEGRRAEVELRSPLKTNPTQVKIALALPRVERDLHIDNCNRKRVLGA